MTDEIKAIRLGILFLTLIEVVGLYLQTWFVASIELSCISLAMAAGLTPQVVIFWALGQASSEPWEGRGRTL